jgi:hypothetical protein
MDTEPVAAPFGFFDRRKHPVRLEMRSKEASYLRASAEFIRYPSRRQLDAAPIEFSSRLETSGLVDTGWFARHVLEHPTKVLDHLGP